MKVTLYTWRNPRPPFGGTEHLYLKGLGWMFELNRDAPDVMRAMDEAWKRHSVRYEEYLCGIKPGRNWPANIKAWHRIAANWMPRAVMGWWLPWFEVEPHLEPMPIGWWRYRTVALVAAKIDGEIVGVGALTVVIGDGRQGMSIFSGDEMAYEIRGVVIDPKYRGRRRRLFKHLCEALLAEARARGDLLTFLATRNPVLQNRIAQGRLVASPAFSYADDIGEHRWPLLACWCQSKPWCFECPLMPGNSLWWPTNEGNGPDRLIYVNGQLQAAREG